MFIIKSSSNDLSSLCLGFIKPAQFNIPLLKNLDKETADKLDLNELTCKNLFFKPILSHQLPEMVLKVM